MSKDVSQRRASIQRRVWELLLRQLPDEYDCQLREDGLLITSVNSEQSYPLSLQALYQRIEQQPEQRRSLIHAFVNEVAVRLSLRTKPVSLTNAESQIYLVLRHRSFTQHAGGQLLLKEHTGETVIAYALDQDEGYQLLKRETIEQAGWSEAELHQLALNNLRQLPHRVRSQQLGENTLHFISPTDGYAASRLLLEELLQQYDQQKRNHLLGAAVPHQDVLIIADLADERGAQLLSQVTIDFASKGTTPISPLPFLYEAGELVPFLMVKHAIQRKRSK